MELKELQLEQDLIDVPVIFDDEGKSTAGFKVRGADSIEYQQANRAHAVLGVKKTSRRGRTIDGKTDTGAAELVDLAKKRAISIANACIVELYGFTKDGEPAPLNEQTLKEIFDARPTWLAKVLAAIENEQLFI